MRTKQQVQAIISRLEEEYPLAECSLQYEKDYELLFATRLSAQCTDERVNKVTPALFERFPSLQSLAEAEVEEVEQYKLLLLYVPLILILMGLLGHTLFSIHMEMLLV